MDHYTYSALLGTIAYLSLWVTLLVIWWLSRKQRAMLIAGNMVTIAGILIAFLAATFLAALLLTYLLGVMSVGVVVATWAIVTVSVTVLARLIARAFESHSTPKTDSGATGTQKTTD